MRKNPLPKKDNWKIAKAAFLTSVTVALLPLGWFLLTGNLTTIQEDWPKYIGFIVVSFFPFYLLYLGLVYVDRRINNKRENSDSQSEETKDLE